MKQARMELQPEGGNKYNRRVGPPGVKIGNWVEEAALWEEMEKRNMTGEKEATTANSIFDVTLDNRTIY